jgi:hypothetical protein
MFSIHYPQPYLGILGGFGGHVCCTWAISATLLAHRISIGTAETAAKPSGNQALWRSVRVPRLTLCEMVQ